MYSTANVLTPGRRPTWTLDIGHWALDIGYYAASIPAITGFLRMRAGKHFFTDVAVGYSIGATIGYLIPVLHR